MSSWSNQAQLSAACTRVVVSPPYSRSSLLYKSWLPLGAQPLLPKQTHTCMYISKESFAHK